MRTGTRPEPSASSALLVSSVYVVPAPGTGAAPNVPFPATSDGATDTVAVAAVVLALASIVTYRSDSATRNVTRRVGRADTDRAAGRKKRDRQKTR